MSSSSAFNPSLIRKDSEPKVERRGRATFSFRDAYEGRFEFFTQRPIDVDSNDDEADSVPTAPEKPSK